MKKHPLLKLFSYSLNKRNKKGHGMLQTIIWSRELLHSFLSSLTPSWPFNEQQFDHFSPFWFAGYSFSTRTQRLLSQAELFGIPFRKTPPHISWEADRGLGGGIGRRCWTHSVLTHFGSWILACIFCCR